jgi:hypothetical protein
VGGAVFAGLAAVEDGLTTPGVAFEFALAVPSALVATTRERIRWPTSACASTYVLLVSPGIVAQLTPFTPPPDVSQRSHRYWNVIGVVPVQLPFVVVSVSPWTVVPETCGSPAFLGGAWARAEPPPGRKSAAAAAPVKAASASDRTTTLEVRCCACCVMAIPPKMDIVVIRRES